jgi:ferredoxin-NADP reductase
VLDEMTTALDPQARRDAWELIAAVRDRGIAIVLVTHDMEEAGRLLSGLPGVRRADRGGQHVIVTGSGELVNVVILALATAGVATRDVQLGSASPEEAFVKLTGQHAAGQHGRQAPEGVSRPGTSGLTLFDSYEPVLVLFGLAMMTFPGPAVFRWE